jgi:hypothetical protein
MDEFPNMNPANNNWSISTTWTQPYLPTSYNPFYQTNEQHDETLNLLSDLECIDRQVDEMLTYPEAEAIIKRVMKQTRGNSND